MTASSDHVDNNKSMVASRSQEMLPVRPLAQRRLRPTREEGAKAFETIKRKGGTALPKTLHRVLGRCLVQCGNIKPELSRLARLLDAPAPKKKGTSAIAPSLTLPAPRYCARKRRETLQLAPEEVWELLLKTLDPVQQVAIKSLSYQLLGQIDEDDLLAGYSTTAMVAGCVQFAASALETEIQFSGKKLRNEGLKVNPQAVRCAYNVLWWERRQFEGLFEEAGATVEALRLPLTSDGSVSRKMLRWDDERDGLEVELGGMRECFERETWSLARYSMAYCGRQSGLKVIESVSDD